MQPHQIVETAYEQRNATNERDTGRGLRKGDGCLAQYARVRLVIARAIMDERNRIQQIIDAEREYGDCHPDDIGKRLWSGEGPRLIGGWNAKHDEDDEDILIPEEGVYVMPTLQSS